MSGSFDGNDGNDGNDGETRQRTPAHPRGRSQPPIGYAPTRHPPKHPCPLNIPAT